MPIINKNPIPTPLIRLLPHLSLRAASAPTRLRPVIHRWCSGQGSHFGSLVRQYRSPISSSAAKAEPSTRVPISRATIRSPSILEPFALSPKTRSAARIACFVGANARDAPHSVATSLTRSVVSPAIRRSPLDVAISDRAIRTRRLSVSLRPIARIAGWRRESAKNASGFGHRRL